MRTTGLDSNMVVEFMRTGNGETDPLNRRWELTVTMRDDMHREHVYSLLGMDNILLPNVEVMALEIFRLLRKGIRNEPAQEDED